MTNAGGGFLARTGGGFLARTGGGFLAAPHIPLYATVSLGQIAWLWKMMRRRSGWMDTVRQEGGMRHVLFAAWMYRAKQRELAVRAMLF